jgi:hypothetical protein
MGSPFKDHDEGKRKNYSYCLNISWYEGTGADSHLKGRGPCFLNKMQKTVKINRK